MVEAPQRYTSHVSSHNMHNLLKAWKLTASKHTPTLSKLFPQPLPRTQGSTLLQSSRNFETDTPSVNGTQASTSAKYVYDCDNSQLIEFVPLICSVSGSYFEYPGRGRRAAAVGLYERHRAVD